MGKLHKIRKAVAANPEKYLPRYVPPYSETAWLHLNGAKMKDGKVSPTYLPAYKKFIYKVLRELGHLPEPVSSKPVPIKLKFKAA